MNIPSSSTAKGPISFKYAVRGNTTIVDRESSNPTIPGPCLVEKIEKAQGLSIKFPEVSGIFIILRVRDFI